MSFRSEGVGTLRRSLAKTGHGLARAGNWLSGQVGPEHERPHGLSHGLSRTVIVLAGVTLALGFWGLSLERAADCHERVPAWFFLDRLYRTVALFEFAEANLRLPECYPYWQLAVARFTGPAATLAFIARILLELVRGPFDRLKLRFFPSATVVVGFGEKGRVRAREAVEYGRRVTAIDVNPTETSHGLARHYGIVLVRGDAGHDETLSRARLADAAEILVATGDDARNLSIAQLIAGRMSAASATERRIEVSIENPLVRRAPGLSPTNRMIDIVSVEDISAYLLCEAARFFEIADLLGQRRIHLVIIGFGRMGASLVAQVLRSGATADLEDTRISVLTPDPDGARELLRLSYPGAEEVSDIAFLAADPRVPLDRHAMMAEVEAGGPVTAIVVLGANCAETLPIALGTREAALRSGRWPAPIFFGTESAESLDCFTHRIEQTRRFSEVLHPFEVSARLCRRELIEQRDLVARQVHEAYRKAFLSMRDGGQRPSSATAESLAPWSELSHTYRQANRRAADHIAAKLASAGCVVPQRTLEVPEHFDLLQDEGSLERLAALEHRAWAIDRRLDGWRPGKVRDNARRIHDCLVPYEALPDPTKELDRAQIREIGNARLKRVPGRVAGRDRPLVRFDLWLGLVGTEPLKAADAAWLSEILARDILPPVLAGHPEHNVTILSPLSPGAELVMAKAAVDHLKAVDRQHRLLQVEGVRTDRAIDEFEARWRSGAVGQLGLSPEGLTWPESRKRLRRAVQAMQHDASCERVLELDPAGPDATAEDVVAASRRQYAYIVQRAHVLVALASEPADAAPGSAGEAVARRSGALPDGIPRYRARPNRTAPGTPGLVLIDIARRQVSVQAVAG